MEWQEFIPLLERARSQGQRTALDQRPELYDDLAFYWEAWITLSRARHDSSGLAVSEIAFYAELNGVTDVPQFVTLITALDAAYRKAANKKAEAKK